jgi:ATP-binding protein involved in chromosome partitioning
VTTEEQITERLEEILVPHVVRSLHYMNLVRDIKVADRKANVVLASTALNEGAQNWVKSKIEESAIGLSEIDGVQVEYVAAKPSDLNKIDHVIAVMSGKGGVGKSLVTGLTAIALRRKGYEVGILDADITGPSIPKMFGIADRPGGSESGILPVTSKSGIEIMSISLFLPSEDDAVIWRGPLIGRAITQFWEEVLWGKLDYLIVDLPPGTADAPLTVMQTLPISGVVIVFTPQDLTTMIVKKAVKMCQQMDKRVLGVVENMSYLYVPEIDKKIEIFGKSKAEEMARAANAPLLGRFPIDPMLAKLCDEGHIEQYNADFLNNLGESLLDVVHSKPR